MINQVQQVRGGASAVTRSGQSQSGSGGSFDELLQRCAEGKSGVNFSKHAMARAEERGIELTDTLLEQLQTSVEKASEKGATNILAFNSNQAFIINVPYSRVITTMTEDEMRENCFTNIDGAVLL